MIISVKIKFENGDEFEIGDVKGLAYEKILNACWLKRHDTFKIKTAKRTLYFPDKNIKIVEIRNEEG